MALPDLDTVPKIGLGTWKNSDSQQCIDTVQESLNIGYRHIDTAQLYENEDAVGEGINRSKVDRDEIFLATKVSFEYLEHDSVIESTMRSLDRLNTDYVDLLYVHWPAENYNPKSTLGAFARLMDDGKIRFIGLSNYTPELLHEARGSLNNSIYAHQVEMHPYLQQEHLREDALEHDTKIVAYSPFRHGTLFEDEKFEEIAAKYGVSIARVSLAWLLEKENIHPIPKATSREHLEDNFKAGELELDQDDVEKIDSIKTVDRYIDPPFAPDWEI